MRWQEILVLPDRSTFPGCLECGGGGDDAARFRFLCRSRFLGSAHHGARSAQLFSA